MMKTITLSNFHEATKQEVFDQVATHLLTQNKKSVSYPVKIDKEFCMLRGINNLKCSIGCIISDEEYEYFELYKYEGKTWYNLANILFDFNIIQKSDITIHNLVYNLQILHDNVDVVDWKSSLLNIAKDYQLDNSVIINHKNIINNL